MGSVTNYSNFRLLFCVFQLTRSVGSVTQYISVYIADINFNSHAPWGAWLNYSNFRLLFCAFQLTRSVGSVTLKSHFGNGVSVFQLTRSVGSVTKYNIAIKKQSTISTHTLRGERDVINVTAKITFWDFNSHAPWGAWLYILYMWSHTTTTERTFY